MLEIQSLDAAYGDRKILHDINLTVRRGEILAMIGPNGAGKSTLIRAVSGVLPLQAGSVRVDGQDLGRLPSMQRALFLAIVPQTPNLQAAFTVYQTVLLGRTPHLSWLGRSTPSDHAKVSWALERTHTLYLAERPVSQLSGGEQQRVLLARALAQDTPILLFDEPTAHLDLQHQASLLNLTRELAREKQLAVLMVLHDLNLASLYADRVALLNEGRLQALGLPAEVLTPELLAPVFQVEVQVIPHPEYGTPLVLPDGHSTSPPSRDYSSQERVI